MQQNIGKTGDLAVVYTPVENPLDYYDRFIKIAFPETVVIPELKDLKDMMINCSITFGRDNFEQTHSSYGDFDFSLSVEEDWETGEVLGYYGSVYISFLNTSVRYSCDNNDPTVWTRTQFNKTNPVILDEYAHIVTSKAPFGWQDYLGRFINVCSMQFNGLYQYNGQMWELAENNLNAKSTSVALDKFYGQNGTEDGTLQNKTNISTPQELQNKIKVCQNIFNLNLDSNYINLSGLLYSVSNITTLPNINTSNVVNMAYMCYNCIDLINIPVFNTSNVNNMYYMFDECKNISILSYHNIAESLPLAENLSNHYISSIGLNINKFSQEDKILLGQKGYVEAIPYVVNISNVSKYWNISYE